MSKHNVGKRSSPADRSTLLLHAAHDPRISGTALTGSAAADCEDPWSDIDLAFGISNPLDLPVVVVVDWTARMYATHRALHHLDFPSGPQLYRVFLLPGTLHVDLALVPASDFRALAPTFRLISGEAQAFSSPTSTPSTPAHPLPEITSGKPHL